MTDAWSADGIDAQYCPPMQGYTMTDAWSADGIDARSCKDSPYLRGCVQTAYRYGSLILAPSNYTWQGIHNPEDNAIPGGYVSTSFPGTDFSVCLPEQDEDGFYRFRHDPEPIWTYFEEGPNSRTAVGRVSVNVDIRFESGEQHTIRFWPLCENISTLTFYRTPILFDV